MIQKYWIETYGCQMNKAESDALEIELRGKGWKAAEIPETANLVIINTCSVRKTAEERIWGRIGFYKKVKQSNLEQKLIITGCMAERLGDKLIVPNSPVDRVFGTFDKKLIIDYAVPEGCAVPEGYKVPVGFGADNYEFAEFHYKEKSFKSFIPIMHGCNNYCSYCIVPYVRGREISRSHDDILKEIKMLEDKGVKEITLLGQNVNSYSYNTNQGILFDFPDLIKIISENIKSIEWIRFLTSHPKDLSEKLIQIMSGSTLFCRHIHLPIQSGSEKILKLMNRKYTPSQYINIIRMIKNYIPEISVSTDLIVGFPGETESDFNETLDIMREVEFSDAFTYYYNPREGTKAYELEDNISIDEKLERLNKVIKLQSDISHKIRQEKIGRIVKVLPESVSKKNKNELLGRTESDEMIVFSGKYDKIGKFTNVKIISLRGNTFRGESIE